MRRVVVLPAPFGPEEAEHPARGRLEAEPVDRHVRAEALRQVADLEHMRHASGGTGASRAGDGGNFARREAPRGIARAARSRARGRSGRAGRAAARGGRQGGHHASHRLLPRRLDPPGPGGAGSAHAPVGSGARAPARRPQGRARGPGPVHGSRRAREARGRRPRRARVLGVEPAGLRLAHALGTRRLRELQDLQHGRPGTGHRHRPAELLPAPRRPARRSAALLVPRAAGHRRGPARGRRPRPGAGRLGQGRDPRPHPEPQHRGAPRQPRDRARARPGLGGRGSPRASITRSTRR